MKRQRKITPAPQPQQQEDAPLAVQPKKCWETFFRCQRSPVLRSQVLTTLMAGTPLEAERVPAGSLLDAVLISFTARAYCNVEVVDDYDALCSRTNEIWARPDFTHKMFSSAHGCAASFILRGSREFHAAEEGYIPAMVGWYLGHDVPNYFHHEVTEQELKKRSVPK